MLSELLNVHMEDFLVKKNVLPMVWDIEWYEPQPYEKRIFAYYKQLEQSVA